MTRSNWKIPYVNWNFKLNKIAKTIWNKETNMYSKKITSFKFYNVNKAWKIPYTICQFLVSLNGGNFNKFVFIKIIHVGFKFGELISTKIRGYESHVAKRKKKNKYGSSN